MSDFCPVSWPEDTTPQDLLACTQCGLYEHGSRMVWGEGNPQANIMILLDNPGAREDRDGNAYVCGTRKTLQQAAHHVGLKAADLYMTYILKRRPRRAYPKEKTRAICMQHLEQQLSMNKPKLIVCLGNVAVQSFFRDGDIEVKSLRGSIHQVNGFPIAVAYHPLAIRRRPNLRQSFLDDWQRVADYYEKLNTTDR